MKHSFFFFLIVLFSIGLMGCQAPSTAVTPPPLSPPPLATTQPADLIPVTIYSDDNYPPYSYIENGEPKGIYVDILKTAFSRLKGYTVTIAPVPWKRGLEQIENGTGFALFPPYFRPVDRPWMDYSTPILTEKLTFFCHEDILKTPRPRWPEDYAGLTIGKNLGFASLPEDEAELTKYNITVNEAVGSETNLMRVAFKRLDCYINDRLSILWELQRLEANGTYDPGGEHAKIVEGITLSSEEGYVGYTLIHPEAFPYKADFKTQLDEILTAMKDSGEIEEIVNQFILQP